MSLGGKTASSQKNKDISQNKIARACISFCFMKIRECGLPAPASRLMLFSTATPLSSRSLCFSATSSSCRWTAWTVKSWQVNHRGHSFRFHHGRWWSENQRRWRKARLFHHNWSISNLACQVSGAAERLNSHEISSRWGPEQHFKVHKCEMEQRRSTWALWSLFSWSLLACRATIFSCLLPFPSGQGWGGTEREGFIFLNQVTSHHPLAQVPLQTFQLDAVLSFSSSPEEGSPEEASQEAGVDQNTHTQTRLCLSAWDNCTFYRKPAVYLRL